MSGSRAKAIRRIAIATVAKSVLRRGKFKNYYRTLKRAWKRGER